ncbi:MAG: ROK family protein [Actinomycetia bacterium]|nr:ROK family protein [Actinomycetes bacterium]MCP4084236.1 ROK family protein [Actinomycetes bacterium]
MEPDILAVDVGGTKLEVGVVSPDGTVGARHRDATINDAGPEGLWAVLAELIQAVRAESGGALPGAVGCGSGGPMTAGGRTVSPLNIPAWRDFPLRARLEEFAGLPAFVDNDAKALALGEGWLGAARGHGSFVAMVVSTGVGGGIVLDGRLLDGDDGNAGHIGHVVVAPDGHEIPHHVRGTLESEASGTGIAHWSGRPAAEAGPEIVEYTGTMVGRAVGSLANLLDLQLAVVAGSVALGFGEPFFVAAQAEIDRVAQLDHSRGTRIIPAGLGSDGPLVGAAAVGRRGLGLDVGGIR